MPKKPDSKAEEKAEDLDLELTEDDLAKVAGGVGIRGRRAGVRGVRVKKLGARLGRTSKKL